MQHARTVERMRNRLLLGNSTERLREIPDESVDLVFTDPPYNTGIKGSLSGTRFRNFFDDALTPEEYHTLVTTTARELFRVLKADRAAYVFINWKSLGIWLEELGRAGFRVKNVIVWDKVVHGMNYQNYAYTHEFLIFAVKGKFHPKNKGTRDDGYRDLWHIQREVKQARNDEFHHETVKPAVLVRRPIEHASERGDLVLDPFFGSGRILVVARELGRNYLGIERDPRFHAMGIEALRNCVTGEGRVAHASSDVRVHAHMPPHRRTARSAWKRRESWRRGR
jgi:DNA modification methylase